MTNCLYWSFCLSFKYTKQALDPCVVIKWDLHMDSIIKVWNKLGHSAGFPQKWWRIIGGNWQLLYSCCIAKLTSTGCLDTGSFVSAPIKSSMNLCTTSQFGILFELNRFLSVIWLHDVMLLLSCVVWSYAMVGDVVKTFAGDWWSFASWKCLTFLGTDFIWISGNCGLIGLNLLTSDELEPFEDDAVSKLIVDEWVG